MRQTKRKKENSSDHLPNPLAQKSNSVSSDEPAPSLVASHSIHLLPTRNNLFFPPTVWTYLKPISHLSSVSTQQAKHPHPLTPSSTCSLRLLARERKPGNWIASSKLGHTVPLLYLLWFNSVQKHSLVGGLEDSQEIVKVLGLLSPIPLTPAVTQREEEFELVGKMQDKRIPHDLGVF